MHRAQSQPSIRDSLKEYGRGIAGGLLFSLPLLYTMEVWWTGFVASPAKLLTYLAFTYCLLLGYNYFSGLHREASWREIFIDSVEELGIGLVLSALILALAGQVSFANHPIENIGKVVVEAMAVAIGVSVGTAQLGVENGNKDTQYKSGDDGFLSELTLAAGGAVLVAANVAPTEEILKISVESNSWKLLVIIVFSLLLTGMILHWSDFKGKRRPKPHRVLPPAFSGIVTYAIALAVSTYLLWFFGRFDGMSLIVGVQQVVVLAFAATLGASAGRLLLTR